MRFTAYFDPEKAPLAFVNEAIRALQPGAVDHSFRVTTCDRISVSSEDCNAVMRLIGILAESGYPGLRGFTVSFSAAERRENKRS